MTRLAGLLLLSAALGACGGSPTNTPAPRDTKTIERAAPVVSPDGGDAVEASAARTPPIAPVEVAPSKHLRVVTVGDIMIGTDYPQNHLPDDDGESFFAEVAAYITDADIGVGNLEGVLMDGGTPRKECKNPAACYLFRSPARYGHLLSEAGFDVLSLANNHSRDFGEEGRTASMQNLAAVGIEHTGREGDFAFLTVDGMKVAVLGYAVTLNSNLLLDYEIAADTVRSIAARNDIVIITFHGGAEGKGVMRLPFAEEEYYGEMRGDVVRFARLMIDSGADLVVGHGPHVVRGMELYGDRLIAYSLGNFATYYGISVDGDKGVAPILNVTLDETGRFVEGRIHSTIQIRPAGPSIDPDQRALQLIRSLSIQDFATPGIDFKSDGRIVAAPRRLNERYTEDPLEL